MNLFVTSRHNIKTCHRQFIKTTMQPNEVKVTDKIFHDLRWQEDQEKEIKLAFGNRMKWNKTRQLVFFGYFPFRLNKMCHFCWQKKLKMCHFCCQKKKCATFLTFHPICYIFMYKAKNELGIRNNFK
jgi:hypothetical protein